MSTEKARTEYRRFMIDIVKEFRDKGYTPLQTFKEMVDSVEKYYLDEYELMTMCRFFERKEVGRKVIRCANCRRHLELYQDSQVIKCADCMSEELFK